MRQTAEVSMTEVNRLTGILFYPMASKFIASERIRDLNGRPPANGDYVLYWMQQSQRAEENHALEYAIQKANDLRRPVIVGFGLTADYPEANLRHYAFMIDGLRDAAEALDKRGIRFILRHGSPSEVALELGRKAAMIVCDRGYLRHQKQWREQVAEEANCAVHQVECDVIVPVDAVSDKQEYAARTFRPKVTRLLESFLAELRQTQPSHPSQDMPIDGLNIDDSDALLGPLAIDSSVSPVALFTGGTRAAKKVLTDFIHRRLHQYAAHRNQPQTDDVSHMSKYLHFGQIAPAYIARKIRDAQTGAPEDRDGYLDELVVRRELTMNFVHRNDAYDQFSCLPRWANETLAEHARDSRPHTYSLGRLEAADTHDPYWNASMNEMKHTGYMHNYMRMYWGKKILEWSDKPENAYRHALHLNNKYFIDGRDPNSYANIGWIFGLHDRPWQERDIYGKVRIMTASGLERKADPEAYVQKVNRLMKKTRSDK